MRCHWCKADDDIYVKYHDDEWGRPIHDDRMLFECLILECFHSGLSWACVLHKRENFRQCFDNFVPEKVALYSDKKIDSLLQNKGIIRHKGKIKASVQNAQIFLNIQKDFGSFDNYIWSWTKGQTIHASPLQATSELSDNISRDLKAKGMNFIGSTVIHSYLCAIGVISAHDKECFLREK